MNGAGRMLNNSDRSVTFIDFLPMHVTPGVSNHIMVMPVVINSYHFISVVIKKSKQT